MMRFNVLAGPAAMEVAPNALVTDRLSKGVDITVYSLLGGVVTAAKQHLFFDKKAGKLGGLYWCATGGVRVQSSNACIALHRLDDITTTKHSGVLRSMVAQGAQEACCLSLTARGDTLHCQFESPDVLQRWLAGIKHVLTTGGVKLQLVQGPHTLTILITFSPRVSRTSFLSWVYTRTLSLVCPTRRACDGCAVRLHLWPPTLPHQCEWGRQRGRQWLDQQRVRRDACPR